MTVSSPRLLNRKENSSLEDPRVFGSDIYTGSSCDDSDFPFSSTIFSKLSDSDIVYAKKEPKVVGSYLVGEVLGKGAYAKVKEGVNVNTQQRVAVKILNKRQLRKIPNGEENVKLEIEIHQKLDHRNIVKFIESFAIAEKNKLYIILEFLDGGSVQDLLEQAPDGRLPPEQARCYVYQLLEALEYLHNFGVVHRDIKPGNMLLTTTGQMKLADFGVSQWISKVDPNSGTQGSPAFQPPEVASGQQRAAGPLGDIWAIGVLLFFISVGRLPFEGQTVFILFEAIAKGEFVFPDGFEDASLRDLISKILQVDPLKRPTLAQIKSHPWFEKRISSYPSSPCLPPHEEPIEKEPATHPNPNPHPHSIPHPHPPHPHPHTHPTPSHLPSPPRPYKERCCTVS